MRDRRTTRARVLEARALVETSTYSDKHKEAMRLILRAPTGRQVAHIIKLCKARQP